MSGAGEGRGPEWAEREYNPRLTVPEAAELMGAWPGRSAAVRAARGPILDISTGSHPREAMDLFRAPHARGTLVFIHGGYFRGFSKSDNSFVADGFVDAGISVALLDYPLCPEVSLEALIESVRQSFAHMMRHVLTDAEKAAVVVSGHSAGGYLTADLLTTDWAVRGLPPRPFHGAAPISGVFDLAPLIDASMNVDIRLTPERAPALDITRRAARVEVPLVIAVGARETAEFHRQSDALASSWAALGPTLIDVADANHFTVLDPLAEPGAPLNAAVMDLFARARTGA